MRKQGEKTMKRTKITLILTIIAIIIFSCGKSNAELKNEFINLTKDKIFLRGYDIYNNKHIVYTFDENGNIIDNKNEIKYYYDSAKNDNEFYFYYKGEGAYFNNIEEYSRELKIYTGFIISNNIVREMVHSIAGDFESFYFDNKKELQKLYSKEGSYITGMLFSKEEYNDYKNKIKTYKYSDFLGTFESEDKNSSITLSIPKGIKRINNRNVYSMISLNNGSTYEDYAEPMYSQYGYMGVFYNNGYIYPEVMIETETDWLPFFNIIIVDKDTLLSTISHSYGSHDISMQYGNYGFLKRKK